MALLMTIATKLDERGIRKAQHSFKKLTGSMKGMLGGALGALGIGMGVRELMNMAKAADADAKSSALLADNLKKLAGATSAQIGFSEAFIQKLSNQVGIVDDNLRPALTELTAVTKDVTKAQQLLVAVLDISKGRGKSQEAVQKAVAKAYAGNTTALTRMFPEMKKTEAAFKANHKGALSMAESVKLGKDMIQKLADENAGNAEKMASPFDKMNVAIDNMKEAVGAKILPMLTDFVKYLTTDVLPNVEKFLDEVSNPNTELGGSISYLTGNLKDLSTEIGNVFAAFSTSGKASDGFALFVNGISDIISMISMRLQHFAKMVNAIKKGDFLTAIAEGNSLIGVGQAISMTQDYMQTQQNKANKKATATKQLFDNAAKNSGVTININGVVGDKVAVGKAVNEALNAYKKTNGGF